MALVSATLERRRFRVGILVLSLGIILMLWAWGNWMYRATMVAESLPAAQPASTNGASTSNAATALARLLIYGFILVIAILLGSFVVIRAMRRNMAAATRRPAEPTPAPEIWGASQANQPDRSIPPDLQD